MTQLEDDATRLARELAVETAGAMAYLNGGLVGMTSERFFATCTERFKMKLRAHLAERDARERMVREQLETLSKVADEVMTAFDHADISSYESMTLARLADAIPSAAKSDEQTPTTTGGTNGT